MLKAVPLLIVTLAASPALAGATPWQDLAPGVKARLISSDKLTGGTTLAALELVMPEGTNTYWRMPGETGIPSIIDFSGSAGVENATIDWPYPQIDTSNGYRDYVYRGTLVLPVSLQSKGADATLVASLMLGVCSDICVPVSAKFTLPTAFAQPDAAQSIRIDQAMAQAPIAWDQPEDPFGAIAASADGASLTIADPDPGIDPASLIVDAGDPGLLFSAPQKSPETGAWTVRLLGEAGAKGLEGRPVQLTFMTANGPYAVTRIVASPTG